MKQDLRLPLAGGRRDFERNHGEGAGRTAQRPSADLRRALRSAVDRDEPAAAALRHKKPVSPISLSCGGAGNSGDVAGARPPEVTMGLSSFIEAA